MKKQLLLERCKEWEGEYKAACLEVARLNKIVVADRNRRTNIKDFFGQLKGLLEDYETKILGAKA